MDTFEWTLFMLVLSLAWFGLLSIMGAIAVYFAVQRIVNNAGQNLNMVVGNVDKAIDAKLDRIDDTINTVGELIGRKPPQVE